MTAAVSEVALPKVVTSAVEFHITLEPATKFVPATVSANGKHPAAAEVAFSELIVGPLTLNVLAEEDAPLEFCTVTLGEPAAAICVLVTAAVSEVVLP